MYNSFHKLCKFAQKGVTQLPQKVTLRTFLSQAYYCQEVWENRLNDPVIQKVNLDELYHDLDQRFQKTRQMSAVDVAIFINSVKNDNYFDEILDVVHKLRLSGDASNILNSTSHAVVRNFIQYHKNQDILQALDDRINYGLFLDYYTANLLFDTLWKQKDFTGGARVASQLMLQEEFDHPVSLNFSLLHCFNHLLKPGEWPIPAPPEEPEDEVKVRVKYIRNPYDDEHFDLRDPTKIIGKTLAMFTQGKDDSLNKSLNILGWILFDQKEKVEGTLKDCKEKKIKLYNEVLDLIPEENELKKLIAPEDLQSTDVQSLLVKNVEKAVQTCSEKDIADQCKVFPQWEEERKQALQEQVHRLSVTKRLSHIEDLKKSLKERETRLWFFDNEEQIELELEEKDKLIASIEVKQDKKVDEDYIPPEVQSKPSNQNKY